MLVKSHGFIIWVRHTTYLSFVTLVASLLLLVVACGAPEKVPTASAPAEPAAAEPNVTETTITEPNVTEPAATEPTSLIDDVTDGKAFIWKITSDNSEIYLLGSVHAANPDIYPLDTTIEQAFALADNLVVEVDITQVDPTYTAQLLFEYGTYPSGNTLKDNIPEDIYIQLEENLGRMGVNIITLDMFRPWVFTTIIEEIQIQETGYSTEYGIDLHFIEKTWEDDKPVIELETAEYQIELISSLSDELMILIIEDSLDNPATKEDMDMLFQAWRNGDVTEFESITFKAFVDNPELEPFLERMFYERNYNMAEKIEEFLADEGIYFIVVGAGHLVGDEGLINLLSKRGYETVQLTKQGK